MNYLLDTNHWSALQRSHPRVVARLQTLPGDAALYMPVVAQAELLVGVELVEDEVRRRQLRDLYENAVGRAAEVLPITSEVARNFARILAGLRRAGTPIDTNDIWIAALARAHNLILATSDGHFRYVAGLTLEDWTKPADE